MNLDRAQVRLRRRTAWEAVDLGFVLGRRWFLKLWLLWWLGALPVFALAALLMSDSPMWVASLVWWFKPVYEPVMTLFIGRAMFGEVQPLARLRREWWRVTRREWPALLWRRLSSVRSFALPVQVLEGLGGADRAERLRILNRNQSVPTWLTLAGVHLEFVLWLGLSLGVVLIVPSEFLPDIGANQLFAADGLFGWGLCLAMVLAMSVFAPFYVAAGFSLYINRRSELEGWDLELAFRRLARRLGNVLAKVAMIALLALPLPALLTDPAHAASERERAKQVIEEILEAPEFGRYEERKVWRLKGEKKEVKESEPKLFDGVLFGQVLEFIGWTGVVIAVALLVVWLSKHYRPSRVSKVTREKPRGPDYLFGMPVHAASLPEDVPGEVRRLLGEGDPRAALALLYRATLVRLVHRYDLKIEDSATEGECTRLVSQSAPVEDSGLFQRLTRGWISTAYAHRPPASAEIERWCGDWERLYGA